MYKVFVAEKIGYILCDRNLIRARAQAYVSEIHYDLFLTDPTYQTVPFSQTYHLNVV